MFYVYIIHSKSTNSFYVGQTENIIVRLNKHNDHFYSESSTKKAFDWELFYLIECESRTQATFIERHIKRMKSRKYYNSLRDYPEVAKKLKQLYK